jgi:hypothetical protein
MTEPIDQDNAMVAEGRFGAKDYFFPDTAEDALLLHVEHGAEPLHPERWPWLGDALVPLPPDPSAHCAAPAACFPNGLAVGTTAISCVHTGGETRTL